MDFFLPVAQVQVSILVILLLSFIVGFISGLFGIGGGFLMTPVLIFMGIPPAFAVAIILGLPDSAFICILCENIQKQNCACRRHKYKT